MPGKIENILKNNTLNGIYKKNCGFDNIEMTFSHDYYLYEVLSHSFTNLPLEALYIIRYHSFYAWHTPRNGIRGYTNLASEEDWKNLPLLKLFHLMFTLSIMEIIMFLAIDCGNTNTVFALYKYSNK